MIGFEACQFAQLRFGEEFHKRCAVACIQIGYDTGSGLTDMIDKRELDLLGLEHLALEGRLLHGCRSCAAGAARGGATDTANFSWAPGRPRAEQRIQRGGGRRGRRAAGAGLS